MKNKTAHPIQAVRFKNDEIELLKKITQDAKENKRGIAAQIKWICEQYYKTK